MVQKSLKIMQYAWYLMQYGVKIVPYAWYQIHYGVFKWHNNCFLSYITIMKNRHGLSGNLYICLTAEELCF